MVAHVIVGVSDPSQVGEARRTAVRLAENAGLTETQRGAVAIVATELGTNLSKYATGGRLLLQVLQRTSGACVEILAVDSGPGMADMERCLRDGFSTGGSPGTGLGAVRRLSSEFDLYSKVGAGTVVLSRVGTGCAPIQRGFQWAAISTPAPHELVCGDAWRVLERDGEIALMVADGLGHGPLAAEAADRAADVFVADGFGAPGAFCDRAHRALAGSRGAVLAAAHVTRGAVVRYAGIGNIAGSIVNPVQSRGMASQNGTVGLQIRKVQQLDYEWPERGLLIMHSDGVSNRWALDAYEGLIVRHPGVVAAVLLRDFGRGRDDATVLAVRSERRSAEPVHE